jgi:uncharacterized protein YajQ (UPF0234 family)
MHQKTFEAIKKLQEVELELHRLKNALEMANKALDAKREFVGLTDEEIKHIEETTTCLENESWLRNLTRNLESKLKEKNGANKPV